MATALSRYPGTARSIQVVVVCVCVCVCVCWENEIPQGDIHWKPITVVILAVI
jgi:hypothetical protein